MSHTSNSKPAFTSIAGGAAAAAQEEGQQLQHDRETAVYKSRIKDLEKQLEHQKSYYLGKLRSKDPLVPVSRINNVNNNVPNIGARRVQELEDQLASAERRFQDAEVRNRDLVRRMEESRAGQSRSTARLRAEANYEVPLGGGEINAGGPDGNMEVEGGKEHGQSSYHATSTPSAPPQAGTSKQPGDFIQFTPSLLRKFLAHPLALILGVVERGASDLFQRKSVGGLPQNGHHASGADSTTQSSESSDHKSHHRAKQHLLRFLDSVNVRQQQAASSAPYPSTDSLHRLRLAVEKEDLGVVRSLVDHCLLEKLSVANGLDPETNDRFCGNPVAGNANTLAFHLFAERWRETHFVNEDFPILEQDLRVHHIRKPKRSRRGQPISHSR
eukprot:g4569.t1